MNNSDNSDNGNPVLRAALAYAARGIKVFPTTADGKAPAISNKRWGEKLGREIQKNKGGLHLATGDEELIRWGFGHRNAGGIGMPCGAVNGMIVADFDLYKTGDEGRNANALFEEYRDEIGQTQIVRTVSGGVHAYFAYEKGHGKFELGEGIEVQTDGAYVLLPPSKGYTWGPRVDREEWEVPPWKGVPNKIATNGSKRDPQLEYRGETPPELLQLIEIINKRNGLWHNSVLELTASLIGSGWSDVEILRYCAQWTRNGFTDRETFEEVAGMIETGRLKFERKKSEEDRSMSAVDMVKKALPRLTVKQRKDLHSVLGRMIDE